MADHSVSNSKKQTGPLGRTHLTQALTKALEAGPAEITQQIQYMLALSQVTSTPPTPPSTPTRTTTVAEARLMALTELRHLLTPSQASQLFEEIQVVKDPLLRLQMSITVMPLLSTDLLTRTAQEVWSEVEQIDDPAIRGELMLKMIPLLEQGLDESAQVAVQLSNIIKLAQSFENIEARVRSLVALAVQLPPMMRISLFNHILDEIDATQNNTLKTNAINAMANQLPTEIEERVLKSAKEISLPHERIRALTSLARTVSVQVQRSLREEAIKTITQIRNEDDRAEAIINFAPHLESANEEDGFPELLEQALGISVTLSRRNMRARALVALAPHLTLDLQGEALAAVHSLSNERDRAILLAELAPTLPPNMLVASLAVAHTMREQDARVHALTILAHYAPEHARSQTVLDALAAASNLPHHYERVTALIALDDVLPEQLLDQAFTNALETTRLIENESARARALSLLGGHLPTSLLGRALDTAYRIFDLQMRLNALAGIVERVPAEERREALKVMLESARNMPFDYKRARALVSIAPHLTTDMIKEALSIADALEDPFDQSSAYIAIAQNTPADTRKQIIQMAWQLITKIDDGYDRASVIAAITPYLPDDMNDQVARLSADVIRSIDDEYDRASAVTILAPILAQGELLTADIRLDRVGILGNVLQAVVEIPTQQQRVAVLRATVPLWVSLDDQARYDLWEKLALPVARLPLADTLYCIGTLTPLLATFVTEADLKNIAHILGLR